MEIPFKYIVLYIIRMLNDRKMPLEIEYNKIINFLSKLLKEAPFTMEEKKEMLENYDDNYEVDSLFSKYYHYFDRDDNKIIFDEDYISDIDELIYGELDDCDEKVIEKIVNTIDGDTGFLEILGIKVRKELYNYMLGIEKEIEDCYDKAYMLEWDNKLCDIKKSNIYNKIKALKTKKLIMLVNMNNLLSYTEHQDLTIYASNIADKANENEHIKLLYTDKDFDEDDIINDVFLRSMFVGGHSYITNLEESMLDNFYGIMRNKKYSMIKFYSNLIGLLDSEAIKHTGLIREELIRVKYKIMYILDSVYGTMIFGNKDNCYDSFKEDYKFAINGIRFFVRDILMYDDDKYKNNEFSMDNIIVYIENVVKKLFIENYYMLTNDSMVVDEINGNRLYGVNTISSGLLMEVIEKPKKKIREV